MDARVQRTLQVLGKCLDVNGGGSGTQAIIYDCNGGANQKWTLP